MIKNISIENFKSIKNLNFEARRVNIFIGEPNTGKSNVLEALGVTGLYNDTTKDINGYVRYSRFTDLFFDVDSQHPSVHNQKRADIQTDDLKTLLLTVGDSLDLSFYQSLEKKDDEPLVHLRFNKSGNIVIEDNINITFEYPQTHYYKFSENLAKQIRESNIFSDSLLTPFGDNLFEIILYNKELKMLIGELFKEKGLEINFNISEKKIEIIKERRDNVSISLPFSSVSDTLQRVIFYLAAMLSNKNSALIFEEPESHIFPFYNQYLAETIGLDEESGNQYFIATHNPYFLGSIAQKTKIEDLAVFITYMENHETRLRQLREDEYPELFDFDIFYNLDRFIEA